MNYTTHNHTQHPCNIHTTLLILFPMAVNVMQSQSQPIPICLEVQIVWIMWSDSLHPLLLVVVLLLGWHGHGHGLRLFLLHHFHLTLRRVLHRLGLTFSRVLSSLGVA